MDEKSVKEAIKDSKRPKLKIYFVVLVVVMALIGGYFVLTGQLQASLAAVRSPAQAQAAQGGIERGVQNISSDLDEISAILGIS